MHTSNRWLWLILLLALVLRLLFAFSQDMTAPYTGGGGDSGWYLANAYALVTGHQPETMVTDVSKLASPPLYFLVTGIPQAIFGQTAAAIIVVRVLQAILSTATCFFAYGLAFRLTGRDRAGLLAALALALSPALIVEAAEIMTETVYVALLAGGMWLYVERITRPAADRLLIGAGVLFGLATLTRAVLLPFPLALAAFLPFALGWRAGWRRALLLVIVYALVVSTWTVYSVARWNRFVIAGEGLPSFLYLGVAGWGGAEAVDQQLAEISPEGDPAAAAADAISGDPLGWARRRVGELAGAYLQPHGTVFYGGTSLRDLALAALRGERSLADVIGGDYFFPKLALYLLHYAALIGGLAGMWLTRHRWRVALPMIGFIAYLTLVHFFLYALPRYLLPNEIFWWVFAAAALDWVIARQARFQQPNSQPFH